MKYHPKLTVDADFVIPFRTMCNLTLKFAEIHTSTTWPVPYYRNGISWRRPGRSASVCFVVQTAALEQEKAEEYCQCGEEFGSDHIFLLTALGHLTVGHASLSIPHKTAWSWSAPLSTRFHVFVSGERRVPFESFTNANSHSWARWMDFISGSV